QKRLTHSNGSAKYNSMYWLSGFNLIAQDEIEVDGVVEDENGNPLPGVNISVEGSSSGTQTDFNGKFNIDVEAGNVLVFSYVGMEELRKEVEKEDENFDVVLKESSSKLDEVIVTSFGQQITRNESTSNVVTVGSEDILKQYFADAMQSLQGKAPGIK